MLRERLIPGRGGAPVRLAEDVRAVSEVADQHPAVLPRADLAGIGFAHKSNYGWPSWLLAKIACWVVVGALPVLVKRGVLPRVAGILLVLVVGAAAIWLAQTKPTF